MDKGEEGCPGPTRGEWRRKDEFGPFFWRDDTYDYGKIFPICVC